MSKNCDSPIERDFCGLEPDSKLPVAAAPQPERATEPCLAFLLKGGWLCNLAKNHGEFHVAGYENEIHWTNSESGWMSKPSVIAEPPTLQSQPVADVGGALPELPSDHCDYEYCTFSRGHIGGCNEGDRYAVELRYKVRALKAENAELRRKLATAEQKYEEDIQIEIDKRDEFYSRAEKAEAELRKLATPTGQSWEHSFKNFHRSLCERFGYCHDEKDWYRDQVSLEEFLAKKLATPGETAEQAWNRGYIAGADHAASDLGATLYGIHVPPYTPPEAQ